MADDLKKAYRTILDEHFPPKMRITFGEGDDEQTLFYEKATWTIDGEEKGLRYGENPGQEAALYRLANGNLVLGEVSCIAPGRYLASDVELLQSGKHPGKINITDADNALNILRYFKDRPCVAIMKHNNPSGVAMADTAGEAYVKADLADRVAAFGGTIAFNCTVDKDAAEEISRRYAEVVVAPDFADGAIEILAQRKNLRIMKIARIDKLHEFVGQRFIDFKSLIDGGLIAQWSYAPQVLTVEDFKPAVTEYKGRTYEVKKKPTAAQLQDMLFGWLVESGVTSNSVIYVKDGVTVGIGTGEQDRVGVAEIARDKAYRKLADRICFERMDMAFNDLLVKDPERAKNIEADVAELSGGLQGATMISDAFFPFRDGVDVGLREGVKAVVQPGGSINDYQAIEACNEHGATMVFTGERSFKH
ncbi:MAG: IMP cyclohydrolase [Deltaproteobacteria bacterium]|nr:IMP cyclohydrolase [bacterium]MCB9477176.1 IMP cyclohydrolase [Deltaproteobacteria bacterium]MCB9479078.1 IMP cyclohydrolase [Deltaproteobacteria bacterium]MCB9488140.1 IMP cyclohydrolase [Deltaproteobacteria bacterium]